MEEEVGAKKSKSHGNNATRWAIFKRSLRRESRKMKLLGSGFKWKRLTNLQISFLDNFLFKIVSMLEGVVLVSTLCFFFLCFGCHFWIWIPLPYFRLFLILFLLWSVRIWVSIVIFWWGIAWFCVEFLNLWIDWTFWMSLIVVSYGVNFFVVDWGKRNDRQFHVFASFWWRKTR